MQGLRYYQLFFRENSEKAHPHTNFRNDTSGQKLRHSIDDSAAKKDTVMRRE